jgi:uncharacterized protein
MLFSLLFICVKIGNFHHTFTRKLKYLSGYHSHMNRNKILNDPVYGFITIPYGILFELVEHPYFQRLRRIKQTGLTHYVYPGALHTRFAHALGAMHLMRQAIDVLRSKEVEITEVEAEAVCIAILLHDIGHGPFSHALEHKLVNIDHEDLSILFMEELNEKFAGRLSLALQIFQNQYHKPFLYQLVSGQLDMDRMDYLNRDSYFTGVSEGIIGYDRIIKMLDVREGKLLVEEKGKYSIEKFLVSRRLMYWQVYLHKTSLAAEQMLIRTMQRAKELAGEGVQFDVSSPLHEFLYNDYSAADFKNDRKRLLDTFAKLDDFDIISAIKSWGNSEDPALSFLAERLINRKLYKTVLRNQAFEQEYINNLSTELNTRFKDRKIDLKYLLFQGSETNNAYSTAKNEINILFKDGTILPISAISEHGIHQKIITKHYLCYPK